MNPKRTRRKANGVGAILTLRYPAEEVPALDAAAEARGMTRGSFMYEAVTREVRRQARQQQKRAAEAA